MSGGVKTALDEAVAEVGALPDGQQLVQATLFDDLGESETGRLDAPSPLSAAITAPSRKGGRPKGARGRRTEAVAAWLLSQHRHPLAVMAEAYSMAPADLAARIGLRKATTTKRTETTVDGKVVAVEEEVETDRYANDVLLEIVKLQLRMAEAVAPYVAQKLPQAVDLNTQAGVTISFAGVSVPARGGVVGGGDQAEVIEGEVMGVRLAVKSDGSSRTPGQGPEKLEEFL